MTIGAALLMLAQAAQAGQAGPAAPPPLPTGCNGPVCAVIMPATEAHPFTDPQLESWRGRLRLEVTRRGQAAFAFQAALANSVSAARGKPLTAPEWIHARRVLKGAADASAELAGSEAEIQAFLTRAATGSTADMAEAEASARSLRATLESF